MASKKSISSCTVSYAALPMKTDLHFNQHCLCYKISKRLQFTSSLFFWKLFETVLHWHNFFQDVRHSQKTFKYRYIYLLWSIFEGTLVIVFIRKMHRLDTTQLVVKVKVDILTVNELWHRFLWNLTNFIEKQDLLALLTGQQKTYA